MVAALLIANAYAWTPLDVQSNLVQFDASPSYTYSDVDSRAGSGGYSVLIRGKDTSWHNRLRGAGQALNGLNRLVLAGLAVTLVAVGSYIFYNTKVLNCYVTTKVREKQQVAYEQKYRRYLHRPQPLIANVKYAIDVYSHERNLVVNGDYVLINRTDKPIDSVHMVLPNRLDLAINLDWSRRILHDSLHQRFTTCKQTRGFRVRQTRQG